MKSGCALAHIFIYMKQLEIRLFEWSKDAGRIHQGIGRVGRRFKECEHDIIEWK